MKMLVKYRSYLIIPKIIKMNLSNLKNLAQINHYLLIVQLMKIKFKIQLEKLHNKNKNLKKISSKIYFKNMKIKNQKRRLIKLMINCNKIN